jgi:hypothetical protein
VNHPVHPAQPGTAWNTRHSLEHPAQPGTPGTPGKFRVKSKEARQKMKNRTIKLGADIIVFLILGSWFSILGSQFLALDSYY